MENLVPLRDLDNAGQQPQEVIPAPYPVPPDEGIARLYAEKVALWRLLHKHFAIPTDNPAVWLNDVWVKSLDAWARAIQLNPNEVAIKHRYLDTVLAPLWKI